MSSIGPAIALVCGSALGLLLTDLYPAGLDHVFGTTLLALAIAALLASFLGRGDGRFVSTALCTAFALFGCGRALLIHAPVTSADLAFYNAAPSATTVTVTGQVSAEPVHSDRSQRLRISARSIVVSRDGQGSPIAISGDILVVVAPFPQHGIGEMLALSGHLTPPPSFSGFDYQAYLARQGVSSYMSFPQTVTLSRDEDPGFAAYISRQREAARTLLQSAIPQPEASIAVGVVTGDG